MYRLACGKTRFIKIFRNPLIQDPQQLQFHISTLSKFQNMHLEDVGKDSVLASPQSGTQAKRKKTKKNQSLKIPEQILTTDVLVSTEEMSPKTPTKRNAKRKATKSAHVEETIEEEAPRKSRRKQKPKIVENFEDAEFQAEEQPVKKKRRRKTPEEEKVYEIPPIEQKLSTSFRGRLGYACLNTMLRNYSTPIFCSRTCRLSTLAELGHEHLQALGMQNIRDLHTLVKWNAENGIFFMRMSSEMFPFASHPVHGYDLSFADEELKAIGKTSKELGVRLTSHPGQFTQLGSPRESVVENAVRDLKYHCEMMDRMNLGRDSVMIIHMGGTFGDKPATLERFRENYKKLPDNIKDRLVLENDEICYNVDDLLPICQELNIPIVFDYHHDWIYPSSRPPAELIPEINELWHRKGIRPKQHLSEPRPGAVTVMEKRAHSDRVSGLPEALPDDMDLMLECKDKEQAVFYIYRLYGLRDVDPRMLRPAAEVESLHTKGRKSNKRARAKAEQAAAENAEEEKECEELVQEIEREAEEHDVLPQDAGEVMAKVLLDGQLDCGSGDEEVVVNRREKGRRAQKNEPAGGNANGLGVTIDAEAESPSKPKRGRKKQTMKL